MNIFRSAKSARADGARITIHLGDARLLLEQELGKTGSNLFDVLVVDAFSSDSTASGNNLRFLNPHPGPPPLGEGA